MHWRGKSVGFQESLTCAEHAGSSCTGPAPGGARVHEGPLTGWKGAGWVYATGVTCQATLGCAVCARCRFKFWHWRVVLGITTMQRHPS